MARHPRVRVYTTPMRSGSGAVNLEFADPCPWCGVRHLYNNRTAEPGPDGTYGPRESDHCGYHSHDLTPSGRHRRVYSGDPNLCEKRHPDVVLVPAEVA